MDFYVAAVTVSPVLLVALAAAYRGRLAGLSRLARWLIGGFILLPAYFAMVVGFIKLGQQDDGGWERVAVLWALMAQIGATIFALYASMKQADE